MSSPKQPTLAEYGAAHPKSNGSNCWVCSHPAERAQIDGVSKRHPVTGKRSMSAKTIVEWLHSIGLTDATTARVENHIQRMDEHLLRYPPKK
jgi:hypothetical protein